jgi:hypothetical protein
MTAGTRPPSFAKSNSIAPPKSSPAILRLGITASRCAKNKKPAGAYRASGPLSALCVALLKPPQARICTVMMMVSVMLRGEPHGRKDYTGGSKKRQAASGTLFFTERC